MATLPMGVRVFVSTQPADMRKSFDGLMALTRRRPQTTRFAPPIQIERHEDAPGHAV